MRSWITVELSQKEINRLLEFDIEEPEGVSKTPLELVTKTAFALMTAGHQVRLTVTNMKPAGSDKK